MSAIVLPLTEPVIWPIRVGPQGGFTQSRVIDSRLMICSNGHYATVIQSLPKTIGIDARRVVVLDVLRNKRNLSDYTGKPVDHGSLASCVAEAERLLEDTSTWLAAQHPQLVPL